jgi:hypothetical protein
MQNNIKFKKLFSISAVILLLVIGSFSSASAAQPTLPTPPPEETIPICSFTSTNIDGSFTPAEWAAAFTIPMYEAGKADHPQIGTAYLLYNPSSQLMYVAVQLEPTVAYAPTASWVRIDGARGAPVAFVLGPTTASNGYEASFFLPIQQHTTIIVHAQCNYVTSNKDTTAATLEFEGRVGIPIFVVPEYLYGGLAAIGACFIAFAAFKSRKNIQAKFNF